jgi:hypothetical protein
MIAVRSILLWVAVLSLADAPLYADEIPNLSRVIDCKLISNQPERLRCYDRAVSEAPTNAPSGAAPDTHFAQGSWVVSLSKSPIGDHPQMVAALEALGGKGALVFRCQDGRTDAYVTIQAYVGAAQPLPVAYAINNGQETETRWIPAKEGNALFVPTRALAIEFIRSLPREATLALTVHDFVGRSELLQFKLGPISDLRDHMADVCDWPVEREQQQPQFVAPAETQLHIAGKLVDVPLTRHKWNVLIQHPHGQK